MKANWKKGFFFVSLLILVPALMYVYLAKPAMEEAERVDYLLAQKRAEFGSRADEAARAGDAEPLTAYTMATIRGQVPEKPYPDRILRDLELLETASGLTVHSVHIDLADGGGTAVELAQLPDGAGVWFMPVRINVTLEGTCRQMDRMLKELETMGRLYHVDRLTLTAGDPEAAVSVHAENLRLQAQASFLTYYAPSLLERGGKSPEIEYLPAGERLHPFS